MYTGIVPTPKTSAGGQRISEPQIIRSDMMSRLNIPILTTNCREKTVHSHPSQLITSTLLSRLNDGPIRRTVHPFGPPLEEVLV